MDAGWSALNLLKQEAIHCKYGIKCKRLRTGWIHDDLLRILQIKAQRLKFCASMDRDVRS